MKTLIGLIPDNEHVIRVQEALRATGISADKITTLVRPSQVWERLEGRKKLATAVRYALAGALLGLVVGALYGIPSGALNCSELGCPIITSTTLLLVISVYWVLGGAFLGVIVGIDRVEQDLYSYVEGVRRGATLVLVQAPTGRTSEITHILQAEHGLLVHSLETV